MDRDEITGTIIFSAIIAVVLASIILMYLTFHVSEQSVATITNKQWTTAVYLKQDYNTVEASCDVITDADGNTSISCSTETVTHTRTLNDRSFAGASQDHVKWPEDFAITCPRCYNTHYGTFTITYRIDGQDTEQTQRVSQEQFERNYVLGLECTVGLNVFGDIRQDSCVAVGR